MANVIKIKAGSGVPTTSNIEDRELAFDRSNNKLYINDSGTIVDLTGQAGGGPASTADRIEFTAQAGEALSKGDVVYISGLSGNTPVVSKADADDANKMPAFGLAGASASLNNSVDIVTFGTLENFDTSAFSVGDTVFVSTTAGALSATKPTGESGLIQNMGHIVRSHASTGAIKIVGAGRTAATPNLNQDKIFIGDATNCAVPIALSSVNLTKLNNDLWSGSANQLLTDDGDGTATSEANLTFDGSHLSIASTGRIYLDGGGSTYITETAGDLVDMVVGGVTLMRFEESGTDSVFTNDNVQLGVGVHKDFVMYHNGTHNYAKLANGNLYFTDESNNNILIVYREGGGIQLTEGDLKIPATSKLYLDGGGNTYIFEESADNVIHYVGGQNKLRFNSTGTILNDAGLALDFRVEGDTDPNLLFVDGSADRVGIGTSSPVRQLHLSGEGVIRLDATSADPGLDFNTAGTNDMQIRYRAASDKLQVYSYGTSSNVMTIQKSNGYVGIGNTSPSYLLDVHGVGRIYSASGDADLRIEGGAINTTSFMIRNGAGNNRVDFLTGGANAMTINSSQNVGIGTVSPDSKLQVEYTTTSNGSAAIAEFGTSGSGAIAGSAHQVIVGGPSVSDYTGIQIFSDTTTGKGVLSFADGRGANDNWRGVVQYDHSANDMEFWTNATEKMKISSAGNVGIGETSPDTLLHIKNTGSGGLTTLKLEDNARLMYLGRDAIAVKDLSNNPAELYINSNTTFSGNIVTGSNITAGGLLSVTSSISTGYGVNFTNGSTNFLQYNNSGEDVLYLRDTTNGAMLMTYGTTRTTIHKNARFDSQVEFEDTNVVINRVSGDLEIRTYGGYDINLMAAGNVGIGVASPSTKLHVLGTSFLNGQLYGGFGAVTTSGTLDWNHSTNARSGNGHTLLLSTATNGPGTTVANTGNTSYYHTLNFEYASYDGDANITQIGIPYYFANLDGVRPVIRSRYVGTWSQWHSIPIANQNGSIQGSKGTAANPSYVFNQGSEISDPDTGMFCPGSNTIGFSTGGTERFRIDSAGHVGINETNPSTELHLGTCPDARAITFDQSGRFNGIGNYFATNSTDSRIDFFLSSGVNDGTTNQEFAMYSSGNFHADADVIAYSTSVGSDIKLKKNIKDISYGLNDVLKIRAVEFDWKEKRQGKHDIGVIAQEIEKIIPEVVQEVNTLKTDGDTHKVVDYAKLSSVLIKAIQEQQEQINKLEEKLNG